MARRDDLAKRLADRLDKSPTKGRAMGAPAGDDAEPVAAASRDASRSSRSAAPSRSRQRKQQPRRAPARPKVPEPQPVARVRRGAPGSVLRGHLIPDDLHRRARRRKVELGTRRGSRVTWDEVMAEAMSLVVDEPRKLRAALDESRLSDPGAARRRLVQATVPGEIDERFVLAHLELADRPDSSTITLEQLWAAAVMLWLRATE